MTSVLLAAVRLPGVVEHPRGAGERHRIGFRYHFMAEVEKHGWDRVMERAITEASEGTDYLYISLDIDVLDPAYAPGTGW